MVETHVYYQNLHSKYIFEVVESQKENPGFCLSDQTTFDPPDPGTISAFTMVRLNRIKYIL